MLQPMDKVTECTDTMKQSIVEDVNDKRPQYSKCRSIRKCLAFTNDEGRDGAGYK